MGKPSLSWFLSYLATKPVAFLTKRRFLECKVTRYARRCQSPKVLIFRLHMTIKSD